MTTYPQQVSGKQQVEVIGAALAADIARKCTGLFGAGAMTLGLLFIMTQLISNEMPVLEKEKNPGQILSFVPKDADTDVQIIQPKLELPKETPQTPRADYADIATLDGVGPITYVPGEIDAPSSDADYGLPGGIALVPISARYPSRAIQMGLCGHAIVRYDIGADGVPMNIAVISSSNRVFNKEAIRAIGRSRYKPHTEGGVPTVIQGKQDKITFQLDDGC